MKRRNVLRVATAYIVVAWLIIQVVETILPKFGFSDEAFRVVVIVLSIGFLPVVIAAWVFQVTPDGLVLDKDAGDARAPAVRSTRRFDRSIIIILSVGITYFAADKFLFTDPPQDAIVADTGFYGERSIAVIPFDNMTADPEQKFLVDGIAEEVLNLLARIRELRVISRSSSFAYKGQNLEITEIAERLDVAHILEGSVRKAGNTIRVTAQLIDARTDTHLWSNTYERELEDIFAIQDEIAADVAKNLQIQLLRPLPRSRHVDPAVLALTQQAKQLAEMRPDGFESKMYDSLQQALEIDPDYIPALEWATSATWHLEYEGLMSLAEKNRLDKEYMDRILAIEPDNAFFDVTLAWDAYVAGDYEAAAQHYSHFLAKDITDSNLVRLSGGFAQHIGRMDTSTSLLKHAVAIDPLCFQCLYQLSRTQLLAGRYEDARKTRRRYVAIGQGGTYHYGQMMLLQDNAADALAHYQSLPEEDEQAIAGRAMAYFSMGELEASDAEFEKLLSVESAEKEALVSVVAAWTGKTELAFDWLDAHLERDPRAATRDVFHPMYESLRSDPRWDEWRDALGMSAARLDAIEFDPDLPE